MHVITKNTPKELNLRSMIILLKDEDNKCQLNVQFSEEVCACKAMWNTFVDMKQIPHPKKEETTGPICDMEVAWQPANEREYGTSMKIYAGDNKKEVNVPVEPRYLYLLRRAFNLKDIDITYPQQQQSSWFFGSSSSSEQYGDEERDWIARGVMPVPEMRQYAYKYTIEVDYEQFPEEYQPIIEEYFQWLMYNWRDGEVMNPKQNPVPEKKVKVYVRFAPMLERMHLYFDTPKYDTTFFYTARLPTYLRRALTLDYDLIFLNKSPRLEQKQQKYQSYMQGNITINISNTPDFSVN